MRSHAIVTLEAVCDQPTDESVEEAAVIELETARLARDLESGVSGEPGAGDAVELRELLRGDRLVGEASGSGNDVGW